MTRLSDLELVLERVKTLETLMIVNRSTGSHELTLLFSIKAAIEKLVEKELP